jgi:hypothetical protein
MPTQALSKQTLKSWWIDMGLLTSAVIAVLSGIYFLFLPQGGYQGGRNPTYGISIIFSRSGWDDIHAWGGVAMIITAVIHLALHWRWVTSMVRRTRNQLMGRCGCMNARGRMNLILNSVVGTSFTLTAISGIYFLFVPGGRWASDPMILFSRTSWDLMHTWAGVTLTVSAIIHIAIHWRWVTNVTTKVARATLPSRKALQGINITNR